MTKLTKLGSVSTATRQTFLVGTIADGFKTTPAPMRTLYSNGSQVYTGQKIQG
jgi:hypothetical protein